MEDGATIRYIILVALFGFAAGIMFTQWYFNKDNNNGQT